jgi:histidyl-tRNA synthetase
MIKPLSISWFYENLPSAQIIEDNFKDIIKKNYTLSGFDSIETPVVERLEILTSKGWDDNEIYALHRLSWEQLDDSSLWLRFDLTVPLARYIAQYEWVLTFPFKRQHIAKVYRWERPQKWRYREFYQADVDIIWNGKLPLFADVEVISTMYNSLKELGSLKEINFWDFVININNKKLLQGFLTSILIKNIKETISIIDKKNKVKSIVPMFESIWLENKQIQSILEYIKISEEKTSEEILKYFKNYNNDLLIEWLNELDYVFKNLITLWVDKKSIKINPAISRWLNYYTWTVFETFISWAENLWSIASWWRYENLCSNFSKNSYPWVWASIWVSRLLVVLNELWKIKNDKKTLIQVMFVNMWEKYLQHNLHLLWQFRSRWINSEIYIDSDSKIQKQLKYANNKGIPYVIIIWEDEYKKWVLQFKDLIKGEQIEIQNNHLWIDELIKIIKK